MPALETLKKITEKATGWARPPSDDLDRLDTGQDSPRGAQDRRE